MAKSSNPDKAFITAKAIRELESEGYYVIKAGITNIKAVCKFDLVAFDLNVFRLIQLREWGGTMSFFRNETQAISHPTNCRVEIWVYRVKQDSFIKEIAGGNE